jgi:tRNA(Ile)-lysidine synthase
MAATRRSPPGDDAPRASRSSGARGGASKGRKALPAAVAEALLRALPEGGRIAIALSGGRDSVALFHAALEIVDAARVEMIAFHVDHGLSKHAKTWAKFSRGLCAAHGVEYHAESVRVAAGPRTSVEAAARSARYTALSEMADAHGVAAILLGHHADDQAETTLLQLFRGAGPRGLAGMPAARFDGRIWWLRPMLRFARDQIDEYAHRIAYRYVDDDSNADTRYRRNALRHEVVPALRRIAPGYPSTLLRAAALQADAAVLLDDLARIDATLAYDGTTLDRTLLATLDARRARNLLRWFLRERGLAAPSTARLAQMLQQLAHAANDARIAIGHEGAEIGVHRGRVIVHRVPLAAYRRDWFGTEAIELPHGTLRLVRGYGAGIATRHLAGCAITIRSGAPGERLQPAGRAARRQVADLLREAGVPRWERLAVPRVYCNESLAAVAPIGIDAAFAAERGEPALVIDWHAAVSPS